MKKQNGNALFLILIAVALFAALSYAVTQSGRGGSGIDREQADLLAAQVFQEVSRIQTAYTRLNISGRYDQIHFTDEAENAAGTIYDDAGNLTTGRTIGIFGPDTGLNLGLSNLPLNIFNGVPAVTNRIEFAYTRLQIDEDSNGTADRDVGTTAQDLSIRLRVLDQAVCEAMNQRINGSRDIPELLAPAITAGFTIDSLNIETGSFDIAQTAPIGITTREYPICARFGPAANSDFQFFGAIEEN